jgi:hypothetical protein
MGLNSEMNAGKGKIAEQGSANALANVRITYNCVERRCGYAGKTKCA